MIIVHSAGISISTSLATPVSSRLMIIFIHIKILLNPDPDDNDNDFRTEEAVKQTAAVLSQLVALTGGRKVNIVIIVAIVAIVIIVVIKTYDHIRS